MLHRFTSYFFIVFLIIPPTLFLQPKQSNAFVIPLLQVAAANGIPFIGRQVISMGARLGIGKYRNMSQLVLPLRPQRGKLYNLVFKNWTPFKTSLAGTSLAYALGFMALQNRFDNSAPACSSVVIETSNTPSWGSYTYQVSNMTAAVNLWNSQQLNSYPNGLASMSVGSLVPSPSGTLVNSALGLWNPNTNILSDVDIAGAITCIEVNVDVSALQDYIDVDLIPFSNSDNEPKLDKLFNDIKNEAANDPFMTIEDSSTSFEGFSLEEVQAQTFDTLNPDGSTTTHSITKDPVTGELLIDGVPQGDFAEIVDRYGVLHRYTIDAVTGDILDNGVPVGNFASWTDVDGVVHRVTQDPLTGRLLVDGIPWNPDISPPPLDPTGGTVITDPYSGVVTVNLPALDLQPLLDSTGTLITEQRKTTDELLKTNKSLKDLYSTAETTNKNLRDLYSSGEQSNLRLDDINNSLKDLYSATNQNNNSTIVDTYSNTETREMSVAGLTGTAQTIIDTSPLNTWVNALNIVPNTGAILPIYSINLFSLGSYTLDFNDYSTFFDAMYAVVIVLSTFAAIRIVFRS